MRFALGLLLLGSVATFVESGDPVPKADKGQEALKQLEGRWVLKSAVAATPEWAARCRSRACARSCARRPGTSSADEPGTAKAARASYSACARVFAPQVALVISR